MNLTSTFWQQTKSPVLMYLRVHIFRSCKKVVSVVLINVKTARPFDFDDLRIAWGSCGRMWHVRKFVREKTSPAASLLVTSTFGDDNFGASASS
ncbi:MAG: hypothetical protein U5L02_08665 [Rheinheimera sp.]|nr:hypothetical protein [Rheinheimera sp.]